MTSRNFYETNIRIENVNKKIAELEKKLAIEIGPRGGKILGYTSSGNKIYEGEHPDHDKIKGRKENMEAAKVHKDQIDYIKKNWYLMGPNIFDKIKHHKKMSEKFTDRALFSDEDKDKDVKPTKIANIIKK